MSEPSLASERNAGPSRTGNRLVGAAVLAGALALWFWLIPWQVDAADTGFMRPQTLPQTCAAGLGIGGLLLIAFPAGATRFDARRTLKSACLLGAALITVWTMAHLGFLWAAPLLSAILALSLRERRWPWLAATAIGLPLAIWLIVEPLLGRSLP